jgi:hypothetical protein
MRRNTTGSYNTAIGIGVLAFNTTASNNTAVGYQAGYSNTTGTANTAVGYQSFYSSNRTADTDASNTGLGYKSGYATTSGQYNVFIGSNAGVGNTTGSFNTFVGGDSGSLITTGTKNTIVGRYSGNQGGLDIRTSSNFIVLSDGDGNPKMYFDAGGTGNIVFSANTNGLFVNATNASYTGEVGQFYSTRNTTNSSYNLISAGCSGVATRFIVRDSGNVVNTNNSYGAISDAKLKENIVDATPKLHKLMQVKVRNYNLKSDQTHKQIGVVAQELEEVFPSLVEEFADRDEKGNALETTTKAVKYSVFVPMLIKAVQELNAKVEAQALEIATLKGN